MWYIMEMVHSRSKWVNSETWGSYIGKCPAPYTTLSHQCLIFSCLAEERQKKMLRRAVGIIWRGMFVRWTTVWLKGCWVTEGWRGRWHDSLWSELHGKREVAWGSVKISSEYLTRLGFIRSNPERAETKIQGSHIEGPVGVSVMFVTLSLLTTSRASSHALSKQERLLT